MINFKLDFQTKTISEGKNSFTFGELSVPKEVQKSEDTVKQYLNGVNFDSFVSKAQGGNVDNFEKAASSEKKSAAELKLELDELNAKKDEYYKNIDNIEKKIDNLIKKAENKLDEAIKIQTGTVKKHEEEVKKAASSELTKYVNSNKNGNDMTKAELSANIQKAMPNIPNLSNVQSIISEATSVAGEIDTNVFNLQTYIYTTQEIENKIVEKQAEYNAALKKEQGTDNTSFDKMVANLKNSNLNSTETIKSYSSIGSTASLLNKFGFVNSGNKSQNYNNGLTLNSTLSNHMQVAGNNSDKSANIKNQGIQQREQTEVSKEKMNSVKDNVSIQTLNEAKNIFTETENEKIEKKGKKDEPVYSYNTDGEVISTDKNGKITKITSPYKDMKPEIDENGKLIFVHLDDELK